MDKFSQHINLYFGKIKNWRVRHRLVYPYPRFWMSVAMFIFLVWFLFSLPRPLFQAPYTTVIEDSGGNFLSARIAPDHQWRFPESDSVPYKFRESVRCFEDEYFYYHPGVNPVSTVRALWQNIRKGRVVSGGSTITMVFFDLETTGTNIVSDRIVEISYHKVSPNGKEETKTMRVNPEMPIPAESSAIHAIECSSVNKAFHRSLVASG